MDVKIGFHNFTNAKPSRTATLFGVGSVTTLFDFV